MTIIEIRPFRNGWEVYESDGVQPMFLNQEDAISYTTGRRAFAAARFALWMQATPKDYAVWEIDPVMAFHGDQ